MNEVTRIILIVSAVVIVVAALIAFSIIMYKVFKIKKKIKNEQARIANEISSKEGEQKLINREDFGESIEEIYYLLPNSMEHENVEICINSCIRNSFKNALFVGNVGIYETIALSNKADLTSYVLKENFDVQKFNEIKEKLKLDFRVEIIDKIDQKFNSILILNNENNFSELFKKYKDYLSDNGMIIVGKTKKNKQQTKKLISEINEINYKYDMLKWHNGFIIIVK